MWKFSILWFALLIFGLSASAQTFINTRVILNRRTENQFTREWQYLTTDLYMLNGHKFNKLVNQIADSRKRGFFSSLFGNTDHLRYLNISAAVNNVEFFGGDLSYPVYSFRIEPSDKKRYQTYTSGSSEVIRLFNNLPLAGQNDIVEATIKGKALTNSTSGQIYGMVAGQLQTLSRITNPTSAVLSLVGEFGDYLKQCHQGNSYHFKSTIRLYEGQNFNRKLYSVKAFMFVPSAKEVPEFKMKTFDKWLDTVTYSRVSRKMLNGFFRDVEYPVLFVANYKSRYISEPVIGDEVNFESIEARRQKIEDAYNNELVNRQTYVQEMKLLEFLEIFAKLKVDINNYKLNYDNKLTDDFSKNYFVIIREYRKLKQTFKNRQKEYKNNPAFKNEFEEKYESILLNAGLYLEANHQLKSIKELVNTLFDLQDQPISALPPKRREVYMRRLYSVDIPESEENSHEARLIVSALQDLEQSQYKEVFKQKVEKLEAMEASETNKPAVKQLKEKIRNTNCRLCKNRVEEAISDFNKRLLKNRIQGKQLQMADYIHAVNDSLYSKVMRLTALQDSLNANYPDTIEKPVQVQMFARDVKAAAKALEEVNTTVEELDSLSQNLESFQDIEQISTLKSQLALARKKLRNHLGAACRKFPKWCE